MAKYDCNWNDQQTPILPAAKPQPTIRKQDEEQEVIIMAHLRPKVNDVGMMTKSATSVRSQLATIHRTSYFETMVHFLKGNIGSGLFAMGDAIKNAGLVVGCVGTVVLGLICLYNDHLLVRCGEIVKRKLNLIADPNFPETIEYSFECGPKSFRRWKSFVGKIVKLFIILTQLGFCSVYFIFVASTMHTVLKSHGYEYDLKIYMVIIFIPMLLSSLIRSIKYMTPISFLANILLLSGCVLTYYVCFKDLPDISERRLISKINTLPLFFGTTIYAFEGISLVIPLRNEMQNPDRFVSPLGVLNVGQSIVILLVSSLGAVAYLKYGDEVQGSVTLNLGDGVLPEVVMSTVALAILFTYALQFHVAIDLIWWDLVAAKGPFNHMVLYESLLRTFFVIVTFFMAALIPHLNLFISLIGAMCSSSLALIFPALSDISLRCSPPEKDEVKETNRFRQVPYFFMNGITLLVAVIGFLTGTFYSIEEIVKAMS